MISLSFAFMLWEPVVDLGDCLCEATGVRQRSIVSAALSGSVLAHAPSPDRGGPGARAQGLLGRVRDHNRQVQEAACSALATLEEAAGPVLVPRLPAVLETLARAVPGYSRRNLRLLYDALSTLADAVGPALAEARAPALFFTFARGY